MYIGQLPFLTHGQHSTSGFDAIVKYVTKLPGGRSLDAALTTLERAQCTARMAHVESVYGDLVVSITFIQSFVSPH